MSQNPETLTMALNALKKQRYFYGLHEEDLNNILSICSVKMSPKDSVLFNEGDASYGMFILLQGSMSINNRKQGKIHDLSPGEIFGEMGAIGKIKRTASAVADTDCIVLHINHMQFTKILNEYPKVGQKVMTNICESLVKRVTELTAKQ
ncbi:MAG: cyclic nucleotide-binding domain-containing protein [Gammaproteobacteria bacterium]|nr:cyclic nucleotide-binding domain-containing protein [Gammaproteobacteria bacterium]MDH5729852.1 cyclic nucleotide-binding domain-containing protein [Gammaproteobacteria bacterium]